MSFKARSPLVLVVVLSLWLATVCNLPWWQAVWRLPEVTGWRGVWSSLLMGVMIASATAALLGLVAWRWTLKPVASLLVIVAAMSSYYMQQYGIVIDTSMVVNVLQTDVKESRDQITWGLGLAVLLLAVPALAWLWLTPQRPDATWRRGLWRNLGLLLGGLVVAVASVLANFQDFSSLMRNHTQLRFLINPLNTVYALGAIGLQPMKRDARVHPLGRDARVAHTTGPAPLVILVLGETARSANFSLNGYNRNTNPELAQEQVLSYRNVWSCGTSTAASLPCMFSHWGREAFEKRTHESENLLDVLQHAGYGVLWLDNQSGCKGQCDRIPHANTASAPDPSLCSSGECLDEILVKSWAAQVAQLPAQQRAQGTVVVLHAMGSHGPAYFRRSPAARKPFQPECPSVSLSLCPREHIVNAYDNSIAYTDHVLSLLIRQLKQQAAQQPTALLYVSDHGESLGENNLYLHGLPYAIAPDVQIHVPWITWLSPAFERQFGVSSACLKKDLDRKISHDHLFHSVLGLMRVQTQAYRPELDVFRACTTSAQHPS